MSILISTAIACGYGLETALERVREVGCGEIDLLAVHGFAHVNPLDLADNWDPTITRIDELLGRYGIAVKCMNCGFSAKFQDRSTDARSIRLKETRALIRTMRHFGLSVIRFESSLHPDGSPWSEADQDRCMDSVEDILEIADGEGVTLCLEPHERTAFETLEQVGRLLERFPDIPIAYDPTHFVAQGADLRETGPLLDNAVVCHLRDAAKGRIQTPCGTGDVPFEWVLSALKERDYSGPISVEYLGFDDSDDFVVESSQQLYTFLRNNWDR